MTRLKQILMVAAIAAPFLWPIPQLAKFYGPFVFAYLFDGDPARP